MRTDFRLEDWIVRPRRECIERGDEIVHIHPKPMEVLECLAAANGEVVTRDELFDAVWPGVFVTDDALTQCVVELRKAFGDSAKNQQIIKTIPKVGFCLVPPVRELDDKKPGRSARLIYLVLGVVVVAALAFYRFAPFGEEPAIPAATESPTSIAVLPFVNISSDPEQEYFSDGITEELLNLLAKMPGLRVISRTTAFSFKGKDVDIPSVAEQLRVSHILEGSVRKSGERVRITAQLVEAQSDAHLWSQSYDRDFVQIFAIQDEIARHVVDAIESTLLGPYPQSVPVDPEAYRLYLLGQYHLKKYDYPEAMELFQKAIALDPQFAQAHLAIASWFGGMTFFGGMPPREGYQKIDAQIARVQEIDSTLPELNRALASRDYYFNWDWEAAEKGFKKAISLIPSHAHSYQTYAWLLSAMRRRDEALTVIRRGLDLDPYSPAMHLTAANVFYLARMHEQAIEQCKAVFVFNPNDPLALSQMGWSYIQMGRLDDAVSFMQQSVKLRPSITQFQWMLGHAYAVAGKTAQARDVLEEMHRQAENRYVMPYGFALVHTGLGEHAEAINWLEKAYEDRNAWMIYLQVEPRLDPLRSDPRFQGLLERMNYPEQGSEVVADT